MCLVTNAINLDVNPFSKVDFYRTTVRHNLVCSLPTEFLLGLSTNNFVLTKKYQAYTESNDTSTLDTFSIYFYAFKTDKSF